MTRPIALCLGGAATVWVDLAAARHLISDRDHIVVACNFAGIQFNGHLDAWVTLHPDMFPDWAAQRTAVGRNTDYRAFAHPSRASAAFEQVAYRWFGSSGLFMAQIALERLGAAGAILCGVPMDGSGGHIHWPGDWRGRHHYQEAFRYAAEDGAPICSMSGWSASVLGVPDGDWLDGLAVPDGDGRVPAEAYLMHVRMLKKRNFTPPERRGLTFVYLKDREYSVKRAWGNAMIARGEAIEIPAPPSPARRAQLAVQGSSDVAGS